MTSPSRLSTPGRPLRASVVLLGCVLALSAAAQDDKRVSREREALRRSQQALKQAEEQRGVVLREKEALGKDKVAAEEALRQAQAQARGVRAQLGSERERAARLQTELTASQAATAEERRQREAAQAGANELAARLAKTQATLDERSATLASVATMLERSTQAHQAVLVRNRLLHAQGRDLVEQVRQRTGSEPVLGLARVDLENWAEDQRDRLDAQRMVTPAAP